MSYCVNCGVELDATASVCPLCQTPVCNPRCPVNREAPLPFPGNRQEVAPVSRKELALVLTTLMAAGKCKLWSDESIFLFPFGCVVCLCNRGIGNGMGMGDFASVYA